MDELFTAEQLQQLRAYRDPQYRLSLLLLGVNLVVLTGFVVSSERLYRGCRRVAAGAGRRLAVTRDIPVLRAFPSALEKLWGGEGWGVALLFGGATFAVGSLIHFPIDVYLGFVHEHRFGMSTETFPRFLRHWLVGATVGAFTTAFAALGIFGLARRLRSWWWILGLVCGATLFVSSSMDPFRARLYSDQSALERGQLRAKLERLLAHSQVDFDDLLVEKTSRRSKRVEAYFAGEGPTRRIIFTDTLLANFTEDEVVAVVAHEAAHVHEARWLSFLGAAIALLAFLFFIHQLFLFGERRGWFGNAAYGDIRYLPLISLCFFILTLLSRPISNALSRERELNADRTAIALTKNPEVFRAMLIKAARINRMDPDPPRWVVLRTFSHPPIRERLAAIAASGKAAPPEKR